MGTACAMVGEWVEAISIGEAELRHDPPEYLPEIQRRARAFINVSCVFDGLRHVLPASNMIFQLGHTATYRELILSSGVYTAEDIASWGPYVQSLIASPTVKQRMEFIKILPPNVSSHEQLAKNMYVEDKTADITSWTGEQILENVCVTPGYVPARSRGNEQDPNAAMEQ